MARTGSQRWRQAVVWLHVITSVGWMAQALVLFAMLTTSFTSSDPSVRVAATSMAHVVDVSLLGPFANASAFTGFMLAASTAWGFFRSWWVLAKFAITIVQLFAGIFLLSGALQGSVAEAATGRPAPTLALLVGTALMASAIAFQAWLSIAKPWRRTPWATTRKPPTATNGMLAAAVAAVLIDIATGLVLGFPSPFSQLVVLAAQLLIRQRELRTEALRAAA
ncbi:hypothetical protein SAMN02982929_03594 [Saccharopolyspora kobensis]|uniref:Uncharacterized protein n=1 Tax=Saccharopolyspora kobensis TaxID=146035 RepID=A0A1H6CVG2_9PSEU|nr:hypothetical protein [Saccharopolyspora kobensis]SEG77020.1 hypothetical protein SAMN02982929_03594 [Saccharopolyspora kobensis]SFD01011.1 hypothetical protein SAMN05216506_102188 [Saccharopolyspora kobensis]